MKLSEVIIYYSKPEVASELVRMARDREITVQYGLDKFGKRPDILQFPNDIKFAVRKGTTSFHCSEERWSDPLQLRQDSTDKELSSLRIGWDLILDVDCPWFDIATATAKLLMQALEYHGIKSYSIKFSGNKGWHIAVPAETFPKLIGGKDVISSYPAIPRAVVEYLTEFIKPNLENEILGLVGGDVKKLAEKLNTKKENFINKDGHFLPNFFSQVDVALASPRHLFRMPYSLHEKTWLVSLPIKPEDIDKFEKDWAKPENIEEFNSLFLNAERTTLEESSQLVIQALDWKAGLERKEGISEVKKFEYAGKVPEQAFPPCMKHVLEGLNDGRKRSLFALLNFLRNVGWGWLEIETKVREWNYKNLPLLKTGYVKSQISWHKKQTIKVPPPNCRQFYKDVGICFPDDICDKIKNPLTYPRFKFKTNKSL